ncbi:MAG: M15 family metallopeptidase [Minisyncoccia bacterium]
MKPIPKSEMLKVKVLENKELLSEIKEDKKIQLLKEHRYLSPYLRTTVRDMLHKASSNLPEGYKFLIVTAYRPLWMQKELYERRTWQMTKKHPFLRIFRPDEFRRIVGLYTAPPGGSSHQDGAAVDLTLTKDGERLDMGTTLTDYGERVHTENNLITDDQRKNRKILYDAMIGAGFANYPLEWWHYCYGNRMWAAYAQKAECFYGRIDDDSGSNIPPPGRRAGVHSFD